MGNITELSQGNLDGLRRQLNECIESAYNKGYDRGYGVGFNEGIAKQKDPNFVPLQRCPTQLEDCKAYKLGIEEFENLFIQEHDYEQFFEDTYGSKNPNYNLYDLVAKYGAKKVLDDFKKWQEQKKKAETEIQVGDEVQFGNGSYGVIISINKNYLRVVMQDGFAMAVLDYEVKKKTGRNFSAEVSQLLDKLKGDK